MGDWSCEFKPTGLEPFELSGVPDGVNAAQFLLDRAKKENVVLTEEIDRLKHEVEAGARDEKELFNCRKACERLDSDNDSLRKQLVDALAERRRLEGQRQQWLDRDRDNQIVIRTLKDVISDLVR